MLVGTECGLDACSGCPQSVQDQAGMWVDRMKTTCVLFILVGIAVARYMRLGLKPKT